MAGSKALTSVAVSPSTLLCPSNDPRQLRATAYFSDSSTLSITTIGNVGIVQNIRLQGQHGRGGHTRRPGQRERHLLLHEWRDHE